MSKRRLSSSSGEDYNGPAKASWIILGLACIAAAVPFFGFASWLVAGPLLTITSVLGIVVITRGGTGMGIGILLTTLIVAPLFIFLAPFVTSLLGLAGAGAALQHTDEQASVRHETLQPIPPPMPFGDSTSNTPPPSPSNLLQRDGYDGVKQTLQEQSPKIFKLKNQNLTAEGLRGYLTSSERLDLAQRELVQRENYNREKMFAIIAKRAGKTPEEVGATFRKLAERFSGSSSIAPVSQP